MDLEPQLAISILKLTREGPVSHEVINRDVRFPAKTLSKLLWKLQNDGLIYLHKGVVEANDTQRLELAIHALKSGSNLETVSGLLQWKEFEAIASIAFERNDYAVRRNFRFKYSGRRWEMDIVGCKRPLTVCVDCKHWHHGPVGSTLKRIVQQQCERTRAFARSLPNPDISIECVFWSNVKFVPAVLSLVVDKFKFYSGVPVVPVLQLQDFLSQLPAHVDSMVQFTADGARNSPNSPEGSLI